MTAGAVPPCRSRRAERVRLAVLPGPARRQWWPVAVGWTLVLIGAVVATY
jgi:hypothetical protein